MRYRQCFNGRRCSVIGLGLRAGDCSERTDEKYVRAITYCLRLGINVFDSASNYRLGLSDRILGGTLTNLFREGVCKREDVLVCTKGGFIREPPGCVETREKWVAKNLVARGILKWSDIANWHAMTPLFIRHQIQEARHNLVGLVPDVYFLHNPEIHHDKLGENNFRGALERCFETLEEAVMEGLIKNYGVATWTLFADRIMKIGSLVHIAERVGGHGTHHFKVVQSPLNVANLLRSPVAEAGVSLFASAPLMQGELPRLPEIFERCSPYAETDYQRALHCVLSVPRVDVAIVGMRSIRHIVENARVADFPLIAPEYLRVP